MQYADDTTLIIEESKVCVQGVMSLLTWFNGK